MKSRRGRAKRGLIIVEVVLFALAILFLLPLYFTGINSFKSLGDILTYPARLPDSWSFANYSRAWTYLNFPRAFTNSLIITVFSNLGVTLFAAMAAYRLVRRQSRFNRLLFLMFVASMVIPFQALMIPLVQVLRQIGLANSLQGVVLTYWGLGIPFSTFLFHGFVSSIPQEIEESAAIDGCRPIGIFWRIVLPLLKPMTVTVILLNTLWFWNDFLLPMLLLHDTGLRTIQLSTNSLFGTFVSKWDLAMAALVIGIVPAIAFFLVLQRQVIEGVSSGGVKG